PGFGLWSTLSRPGAIRIVAEGTGPQVVVHDRVPDDEHVEQGVGVESLHGTVVVGARVRVELALQVAESRLQKRPGQWSIGKDKSRPAGRRLERQNTQDDNGHRVPVFAGVRLEFVRRDGLSRPKNGEFAAYRPQQVDRDDGD